MLQIYFWNVIRHINQKPQYSTVSQKVIINLNNIDGCTYNFIWSSPLTCSTCRKETILTKLKVILTLTYFNHSPNVTTVNLQFLI